MPTALRPEWTPQASVLLSWPHDKAIWQTLSSAIIHTYIKLVYAIAQFSDLTILCPTAASQDELTKCLQQQNLPMQRIQCLCVATNDIWIRDYGPLSIGNNDHIQLLDFEFNAWGDKYPYAFDNKVNDALQQQGHFGNTPMLQQNLVLEGGSIDYDGQGSLLSTRDCLLHPSRNPDYSEAQLQDELQQVLGVQQVLWLEGCTLLGDDTDAHIDNLARFCNPQTICYITCDDRHDPRYKGLRTIEKQLVSLKNCEGVPYKLVPLPSPSLVTDQHNTILPASYANFLILNQAVLVPIYGVAEDSQALHILSQCFPQHQIRGVDCRTLVHQYGSLHCATMQLPCLRTSQT